MGRDISPDQTLEKTSGDLALFVNDLINNDFEKLVQLLYRVDVQEAKLKKILKENPGKDAGNMIAGMIIDRQAEKLRTREAFKKITKDFPGEESW